MEVHSIICAATSFQIEPANKPVDATARSPVVKPASPAPTNHFLRSPDTTMTNIKDIFTYAYRGSGKYIFLLCVILSIVAKLVGFAPLLGPLAAILLFGYFCAVYYQMVQSSATGGQEAPEFPDTANIMEDIFWPMCQIIAVFLVSFGPLIGYSFWVGEAGFDNRIGNILLAIGVIYFPMAMLAVVVLGYTGAMSPHIVIPSICCGGWNYWIGVLLLCVLYFGRSIAQSMMSGYFIFGHIVMSIIGIYIMMTNARILGLVYRERQEELAWI